MDYGEHARGFRWRSVQIKYWVRYPNLFTERRSINVSHHLFNNVNAEEADSLMEHRGPLNWIIIFHCNESYLNHMVGLDNWGIHSVSLNNFPLQKEPELCDDGWSTVSEMRSQIISAKGVVSFLKRIHAEDLKNKDVEDGISDYTKWRIGFKSTKNIGKLKLLTDYLCFIENPNSGYYEFERCKLHQKLFGIAGQCRIKDRDSAFGRELDSLICDAMVCPKCGISLRRDNYCFNGHYTDLSSNRDIIKLVVYNLKKRGWLLKK